MKCLPRFVYCHLLQYHKPTSTHKLPFVVPLNWNTLHIGNRIHCHWHFIQVDQSLRGISSAAPIMAFKRNRNIKDILVHPTLITDHKLYFDYDDYYVLNPSISFILFLCTRGLPQILLHILNEHDEYFQMIYSILGNSIIRILHICPKSYHPVHLSKIEMFHTPSEYLRAE